MGNNGDMSDDISNKVQIFSTTDDKLKIIGEILSNESSRTIYSLLIQNELPTLQICKQTELPLSLVLHHLNKMVLVEIVTISKVEKSEKNQDMKFYKAKSAIIVLPNDKSLGEAKTSKMFSKSVNKILKFVGVGIVGITSWLITEIMLKPPITLDRPSGNPLQSYQYVAIIVGLVVIVIGLVTERFFIKKSH
jgi:DNA-binding transcriptional ArsR family regulator